MVADWIKLYPSRKQGEENVLGWYCLTKAIANLKGKLDYCNDLPDDLKVHGIEMVREYLKDVTEANEELLGYKIDPEYDEDEIKCHIENAISLYMQRATEERILHYNNEDECYYDENGEYINEDAFSKSYICREYALEDLIDKYNNEHPRGREIENEIHLLNWACIRKIEEEIERQEFIKNIMRHSKKTTKNPQPSLSDFITGKHEIILSFIDNELKNSTKRHGKLIASIIIVLHRHTFLKPYKDNLCKMHTAFRNRYPDKVGAFQGIVDYINSIDKPQYAGLKQLTKKDLEVIEERLKKFVE